jgi:formylglycine-generating enzyme required for sulfatase activity
MRNISLIVMVVLAGGFASADTFGTGANQFTIDFVDITGDASSANGTSIGGGKTFVDPGYDYRMGIYEITNDQWNKFKAEYGTITGMPSTAYDSDAYFTGSSVPTNNVSWYEAAQFVNYLNVSSGYQAAYKFSGTQGTGDYALSIWSEIEAWEGSNLYRHKDAHYFLPTEDEWVKAAYWNGNFIQTYATVDGSAPQAGVDSNYNGAASAQTWDVGSGTEELNGTYDMMGNVYEWMENPYSDENYGDASSRGIRGGYYYYNTGTLLTSSSRSGRISYDEISILGFRVASVPEPTSLVLLSAAGLLLRKKIS